MQLRSLKEEPSIRAQLIGLPSVFQCNMVINVEKNKRLILNFILFLIETIKTNPKRLMDITNEVKELPDMNDDELISGIIENFYEFANIEFNKKIFLHP